VYRWSWICPEFGLAMPRRPQRRHGVRLTVEVLEPRELPATITVLSLADGPSSGPLTLRGGISSASPGDTIVFDPSLSGTIDLNPSAGGTLTINKNVTIEGPGITIEGGSQPGSGNVQDFSIASGASVTLEDLTISNGYTPGYGGAIDNGGTLALIGCTLSSNQAGGGGGAIYNHGTLTISDSTLSGNSAPHGGAIDNKGTLTISDSILSGNSATYGGAIDNHSSVTITGSTLSGNSATYGGAIDNLSTVTIAGSTLTGNSATYGGGIDNRGTLTVNGSTLSGNSAVKDGGGINNVGTATITGSRLTHDSAKRGDRIFNSDRGSLTIDGNDQAAVVSSGGKSDHGADAGYVVRYHGGNDADIKEPPAADGHGDSGPKGAGGSVAHLGKPPDAGNDDLGRAVPVVASEGSESGGLEAKETPPPAAVAPVVVAPQTLTGAAPLLVAYALPGMVLGAVVARKLRRQRLPRTLWFRTVRPVPEASSTPSVDAPQQTRSLPGPAACSVSLETQLRARHPLARFSGRIWAIVTSILMALVVKYTVSLIGPSEAEQPIPVVIPHPAAEQAQPSLPTQPKAAPVPMPPNPSQLRPAPRKSPRANGTR
jgi:predicted outer membrane repeat protein